MIKAVIFDMFETLVTHYNSPLYFGSDIASDLRIDIKKFMEIWNKYEEDRTLGKVDLEYVISEILRDNDMYSDALIDFVVNKRIEIKRKCFENTPKEILEMLKILKKKSIKIGLISNCFSEEVEVIKQSPLYEYLDVCCLSYEMGMKKPEQQIFKECIRKLGVYESECIYVGDGGSHELEAASIAGIKAVQAIWFINEQSQQSVIDGYNHLEKPLDIINLLKIEDHVIN